jgi:hypothetical protein
MQPDFTLGLLALPLFPVLPSGSSDGRLYNSVGRCAFGERNGDFDGSGTSISQDLMANNDDFERVIAPREKLFDNS